MLECPKHAKGTHAESGLQEASFIMILIIRICFEIQISCFGFLAAILAGTSAVLFGAPGFHCS